tara:strand:+ start:2898 stop:3275 length:378 start_codon:yes stop_codon:yes gene_type:complete
MIQINNTNVAQTIYLKLDGYSDTLLEQVKITFTNQLTSKEEVFYVKVLTTNGRYQSVAVTPPAETDPPSNAKMVEGLYLVHFQDEIGARTYAKRLAFVSNAVPFSESTYEAYTVGEGDAYNVYTR